MMKAWIAAALCSLALTPMASADWQYTRWGMNPDQVVAASNGTVSRVQSDESIRELRLRAQGQHIEGGRTFRSQFFFSNRNRLAAMRLTLSDIADCARLRDELVAQFGQPSEMHNIPIGIDVLYWQREGDIVTFTQALQRIEATPDLGCIVFHRPVED